MSSIGNNINGEFSHLRDTFFGSSGFTVSSNMKGNGEVDYLKELLTKSATARSLYHKFRKIPPRILYEQALQRIELIDNGQVKNEDLPVVEAEIALRLAAIEDLEHILELELLPDDSGYEPGR